MSKKCRQCGVSQPKSNFNKGPGYKDGRRNQCKSCINYNRRRKGRSETPEQRRQYRLKDKYGITIEEYDNLYRSQKGACAICSKKLDVLCVDHCHTTGDIRGLLCSPCNSGIGLLQDDATLCKIASKYLESK